MSRKCFFILTNFSEQLAGAEEVCCGIALLSNAICGMKQFLWQ